MSFSESGNKLAVVVNCNEGCALRSGAPVSGLLIYSRIPSLHMLHLTPATKLVFGEPIRNVHLLGRDYFGSSMADRATAISTEPLHETAIVLFEKAKNTRKGNE